MGLAQRFFNLFLGLQCAYGIYELEGTAEQGEKAKGKGRTIRDSLTVDLWEKHLSGKLSIGVIPINEQGNCKWGVVDVDRYVDLNHQALCQKVESLKLPLVVCRSKSGGAHLFVFFSEEVPATNVQRKLREIASSMGFGNCEIFPKQASINIERGDVGNWLNMPYFDHELTTRMGYNPQGESLASEEFLTYAESRKITKEKFESLKVHVGVKLFQDGPPCLEAIYSEGIKDGQRNTVLFNTAVYLRKSKPGTWEAEIETYRDHFIAAGGIQSRDIQEVIKSANRKDYSYQCQEHPLCDHCNVTLCRTRRFGVSPEAALPVFSGLEKLDSDTPLWILTIEGVGKLELNTDQLMKSEQLEKAAVDQLNLILPLMKRNEWRSILQNLFDNLTIVEMSVEERKDASVSGRFEHLLEQFCTEQSAASNKEEVLLGLPYHDDSGHTHFRLSDFEEHLQRRGFRDYNRSRITRQLRILGGASRFAKIKGRGVNLWQIPSFLRQSESFDLPDMGEEPF